MDRDASSHTPALVLQGLARVGYDQINHVSQNGWRENEYMACDLNVIYGMRTNGKEIIANHLDKGVKSIVIDLGYIKRAMKSNEYSGYWQVGLNGLNWTPKSAPDDRFKELGIDYPKHNKRSGYVLLAEQTPFDASHGMDQLGLKDWMDKAVERCEELGLEYKKRRHPMNSFIDEAEKPKTSIEEDLAGASCVYVHNSNVGNDALLAGVPVVCDKGAAYAPTYFDEVSNDLAQRDYPKKIKPYLDRLAYAQWTRDEIANGKAFDYALKM